MSPERRVVHVRRKKKIQIKALSVRQPWASLIASRKKTIEVREWRTKHQGPLLICASKRPAAPPCGCMVALVNLVECRPLAPADERAAQVKREPERRQVAWVLKNVRRVPPHPVTGKPGLFDCDLPPDVAKLL